MSKLDEIRKVIEESPAKAHPDFDDILKTLEIIEGLEVQIVKYEEELGDNRDEAFEQLIKNFKAASYYSQSELLKAVILKEKLLIQEEKD